MNDNCFQHYQNGCFRVPLGKQNMGCCCLKNAHVSGVFFWLFWLFCLLLLLSCVVFGVLCLVVWRCGLVVQEQYSMNA